jgi:hypothetical protein
VGGGEVILAGKKLNRSGLKYSHLSNGQLTLKCDPAPHTLHKLYSRLYDRTREKAAGKEREECFGLRIVIIGMVRLLCWTRVAKVIG